MSKNSFVIAVYVENKYGVLTRVTSMFTRRGFNIDTLTVGETEDPNYSRITISLSNEKTDREQLINQLKKLYNVRKVEVISSDVAIKRELMLIKVKNTPDTRAEIRDTASVFRAKIIDYSAEAMCLEITGDTNKIDAFIDNMKPFGIIEMCRTGIVALERGPESMLSKE
ncbi:acetolactate synthase, small subunit [Ruminococcaceae bacterium KH2T8]|nr:acetolactate synthase, small subunit [Ruminococcaceae bacterium KH2T8]